MDQEVTAAQDLTNILLATVNNLLAMEGKRSNHDLFIQIWQFYLTELFPLVTRNLFMTLTYKFP